MSQLDGITLTMENFEDFFIPRKYIKSMNLMGIRKDLSLNYDGEVEESIGCSTVTLEFDYEKVNESETDAITWNGCTGLGDRLKHFCDVVSIELCYQDGRTTVINVPWDFRSDTYNYKMLVSINKHENREQLIISDDDKALSDFKFYHSC